MHQVYIELIFVTYHLYNIFYFSVIDSDLAVWEKKGSIPEEEFKAVKKRGVHYQIINHKLYREEACMFPFRYGHTCQGHNVNFVMPLVVH